jgi:hypothetical protein
MACAKYGSPCSSSLRDTPPGRNTMSSLREYLVQKRDALFGEGFVESPPALQLGLLESCLTNSFLVQAAVRQVPLDGIEVDVAGPALQYTIRINSPASDAELIELHTAVEDACTVLGGTLPSQQISGEIVRTTGTTVNSVTVGARSAVAV